MKQFSRGGRQDGGGAGKDALRTAWGGRRFPVFFTADHCRHTALLLGSVSLQRKGLCLTIQGETETAGQLPPIYPIRHKASAIIVGALGFFLCLALRTLEEAEEGGDCVAKRSARSNLWASLFVLLAAMLRYQDLDFVERCQASLEEEDTLPD